MPGLRLRMYRGLAGALQGFILPLISSRTRRNLAPRLSEVRPEGGAKTGKSCIWFHAASVGELEVLWTLVELAAREGSSLILTVFSESADRAVARLAESANGIAPGSVVFAGYSPWEGRWGEALQRLAPSLFVTAKYEAWPELWASLSELGVPLVMVNARKRSSILKARAACRWMGVALPRILFLPIGNDEAKELQQSFGQQATVKAIGDPRWDRVLGRKQVENVRINELLQWAKQNTFARPWVVLGSAWPEDLRQFAQVLKSLQGTLWIVPHSTTQKNLLKLEAELGGTRGREFRTSQMDALHEGGANGSPAATLVWVIEHGILSELYGHCDWAYVGGGFRPEGLHSVIEPAVAGIPILAGPSKVDSMSEVAVLIRSGQLRLLTDPASIGAWFEAESKILPPERVRRKAAWQAEALSRAGASERSWTEMVSLLKAKR